jgi:CheY-like chemotaxis protein
VQFMPEPADIDWVKRATNELNNLLQGILESSRLLQLSAPITPETNRYFSIIHSGVERAVAVTRQMQERTNGFAPEFEGSKKSEKSPTSHSTSNLKIRIANEHGAKELILIVDDEEFVTLLTERILTDEGYRVITARDGFSAIEIYRKLGKAISLVILDFTMPVMDGAEVFHELRQIDPDAAVVLSSGFTEQDKLRWMLSRGLRGFVPKPYTQNKLLYQIRLALGGATC